MGLSWSDRRYRAVSCHVDENDVWRVIAVKPNETRITRLEREGWPMSVQPPASVQARPNDTCIVVAEFRLNHHHSFRAELVVRAGKPMVSHHRLKITPLGARRTGQAFEFGALKWPQGSAITTTISTI